ncbi:unnamed protein product [Nippostrongylus brasiliensis]|uniref:Uncharacterized protein n=1 Tax=Nippostrongylus brasiliensis TaxID=27835 RepID=A0A0N4YHP3_NIPBR|nr:unnamed protein product [Nippostrongylus brasiliensis]
MPQVQRKPRPTSRMVLHLGPDRPWKESSSLDSYDRLVDCLGHSEPEAECSFGILGAPARYWQLFNWTIEERKKSALLNTVVLVAAFDYSVTKNSATITLTDREFDRQAAQKAPSAKERLVSVGVVLIPVCS